MKIQKLIKASVILMGLSAVLFAAKPVRAQQDAAPDNFPETSDSSPVPVEAAQVSVIPVAPQTSTSSAIVAEPTATTEVESSLLNPVDTTTVTTLMLAIGLLVLYGIVETIRKREPRRQQHQIAYTANFGPAA
jgi:hypothetical protein